MKTLSLSEEQIKLLADAVWMRQRCFIAGDRRFKEYGAMLDELLEKKLKHYKIQNSKYKSIDQFELPVTLTKEVKKKYGLDFK